MILFWNSQKTSAVKVSVNFSLKIKGGASFMKSFMKYNTALEMSI